MFQNPGNRNECTGNAEKRKQKFIIEKKKNHLLLSIYFLLLVGWQANNQTHVYRVERMENNNERDFRMVFFFEDKNKIESDRIDVQSNFGYMFVCCGLLLCMNTIEEFFFHVFLFSNCFFFYSLIRHSSDHFI